MTHKTNSRPVWLFSMDSDQFYAAPTTTGGLKAYFLEYSAQPESATIELVHFRDGHAALAWPEQWRTEALPLAQAAVAQGLAPIIGFSFYTWNAAEFLTLIRDMKASCPELLVLAGGPHVQQAEDYLFEDPIDLIVMGEGEETFEELLDNSARENWANINGLAFVRNGEIVKTPERSRRRDLDALPSALNVVPLSDKNGKALYDSISYETSRGCPFKCAFCEWGTGAIGTKMYQFSLERVERDWRQIVAAGIKDIWLADSNFGALKEDLAKAQLICDLKAETGYPNTFATSWSKKHSPRVQEIVLLLNKNGLLPHYQLALQTLTPLALELSNRTNMSSNKYEPIAKEMAAQGVPIAAEMIWGLPGDNLHDFEKNLDKLLATFPNINIFGYTLLPGTEFYRRREEYKIDTIPVAGYGKAKGEYVVGCHTFGRDEGFEGYFLISSHILFVHGHLMPLTTRFLALSGTQGISSLLRALSRAALKEYVSELDGLDVSDRIAIYENRSTIYLAMLKTPQKTYQMLEREILKWLRSEGHSEQFIDQLRCVLALDKTLSPRMGAKASAWQHFDFDAESLLKTLSAMELPEWERILDQQQDVLIETPGGVGDILKDPDGGSWLKATILRSALSVDRMPA
ncbi:MAG: tRNA A37 methylthiotransferase MiaB [Paracoccaceae bacterium]|jgi:tRNA A37 methylthiotransferase MiaB